MEALPFLPLLLLLLLGMVTNIPSLLDLRLFHRLDIQLFNRIVGRLRKNPVVTKRVFSLWFSIEERGCLGLLQTISQSNDNIIEIVFDQTVSCFDHIGCNATEPRNPNELIFSQLGIKSINRGKIYRDRDTLFRRTGYFLNSICNVIFDENAARRFGNPKVCGVFKQLGERSSTSAEASTQFGDCSRTCPRLYKEFGETSNNQSGIYKLFPESSSTDSRVFHQEFRQFGEGSSRCVKAYAPNYHVATSNTLNPTAMPFYADTLPPRDRRTMFLTFSNGYPFSKEEILEFFTKMYGDVIEDVVINESREHIVPQSAIIVFNNAQTMPQILNGDNIAKFIVNGKALWARIYVPKPQK